MIVQFLRAEETEQLIRAKRWRKTAKMIHKGNRALAMHSVRIFARVNKRNMGLFWSDGLPSKS
eukprot:1156043-Pelagomonas_calceolata.AAC.12